MVLLTPLEIESIKLSSATRFTPRALHPRYGLVSCPIGRYGAPTAGVGCTSMKYAVGVAYRRHEVENANGRIRHPCTSPSDFPMNTGKRQPRLAAPYCLFSLMEHSLTHFGPPGVSNVAVCVIHCSLLCSYVVIPATTEHCSKRVCEGQARRGKRCRAGGQQERCAQGAIGGLKGGRSL